MADYTLNKEFPLTEVQNEMVEFMLKTPSCINAGQTGLGKTYTTLTALAHLLLKYKDLVGIICVPPKALKIFRKELTEKLKVSFSEYSTQNKELKKARIILVSHTSLAEFAPKIHELKNKGFKIAFVLDEAHICQAEGNNFTMTVRTLRHLFPICWLLTATPLGNDVWGLYNLYYLVNHRIFGTKEQFKRDFLIISFKKVKKWNVFKKRYEFPEQEVIEGYRNLDLLKERISTTMILKQKRYNLKFHYHKITLTEKEIESYMLASQGLARKTSEKNWAVRVNDLQRVLDNSSEVFSDANTLSSKERLLVKVLLEQIGNHAIIIYTELSDNIERLKLIINLLKKNGHKIGDIHEVTGTQSFKVRAQVEENLKKSDVVLITQAGTESINLQRADSIILYNTPFSIRVFIQLVGRVTRLDTKHPEQHIHFIEAVGTVDTYRRLNISMNGNLINAIFGDIETLPVELSFVDNATQQKIRNKLLWSFRDRRLPTEEEIERLLETI